ncbi:hypothetical protein F4780DRAFT_635945 [Xylariomycetidae sp. FL0641]|nr:hypothetical protein F4780DRAFT_635945 [Xylariomycetidae sp. FL0641]
MAVPRTSEVVPGARVNIVLKADQRTGRQVSGAVRDVLTRGDHHRGIKVRLTDGRIGRVQSMASASASSSGPDLSSSTPGGSGTSTSAASTQDSQPTSVGAEMSVRGSGKQRPRYRDVRLDEPLETAPEQLDLAAYIVPSKKKGKGKKGPPKTDQAEGAIDGGQIPETTGLPEAVDVKSATAMCPVCGNFEGDEAAVAHHVTGHFE